ncbi:MAG: hypothetical protein ACK5B6_02750 [Bacteroidia bacterium]|jgi:hypothetical protein
MKTIALSLLMVLPGAMLHAQNYFEVKSLENSDVLNQYVTIDEAGNPLELLAALKVQINNKECDKQGVPLYLKSAEKKEYNRPKLYCWNPMARCWQKSVEVQKMAGKDGPMYSANVKCPGIYAFFDSGINTAEKGVIITMPTRCAIRSVRLIQQVPAFANYWEGKGTNELKLPFGPLQFDALLDISWEENGTLHQSKFLCGALTKVDAAPEGQYRTLEIKPGKSVEFLSAHFTNNSN